MTNDEDIIKNCVSAIIQYQVAMIDMSKDSRELRKQAAKNYDAAMQSLCNLQKTQEDAL